MTTNILGISAYYHDSAAALVRDGEVAAAAQEERFTRKKHDHAFPENAVNYCLDQAEISIADVDLLVFYEKPFLKFDRLVETYIATFPNCVKSFFRSIPLWLSERLWIPAELKKQTGYKGRLMFTEHHESHAASAFYPSPFDEAAYLTLDGVGEWTTAQYGIGRGNDLTIIGELNFPHSLGLLYSAFTQYCGFKVNSGEYKLMGLAPYGKPKYVDLILEKIIAHSYDGSFQLDTKYFGFLSELSMINKEFEDLFGEPARTPESEMSQFYMDIARSIQEVTEEIVMRMADHIYRHTKLDKLCLSGGVALNCVANGRLLREGPFSDIWIQPAAGDAGGALGAALRAWYYYLDNGRKPSNSEDQMQGAYLGPSFSDDEIGAFLAEKEIPYTKLQPDELTKTAARLIAEGSVVGWFNGRMEFGPRALGNRSILGDPRNPEMQTTMNLKIKFRESFRPFAPAVLEEYAPEWFDLDYPSPYMLLVAPVAKEHWLNTDKYVGEQGLRLLSVNRSKIPAVTHIDYSARVQTVSKKTNPLFHQLLTDFKNLTGCPVVINTSFNVRGEPIVCTPEDAYRCFMRTNMDYLVVGSFLLSKIDQPVGDTDESWKEEFALD